jgi:hypothetical protein
MDLLARLIPEGGRDRDDRARGLADEPVRDASENGPLEARAAVGADDDDVCPLLIGHFEDPLGGRSVLPADPHLEP